MCIFVNIFPFHKSCLSHHLLIWALLLLPVSLNFIFRCQLWAELENPAGYIFRHSKQNFSRVFEDPIRADHVRSQNHLESFGCLMKGVVKADGNGKGSNNRGLYDWTLHAGQGRLTIARQLSGVGGLSTRESCQQRERNDSCIRQLWWGSLSAFSPYAVLIFPSMNLD
jgi:hypothetical protein